jgi:hypothetical protein
MTQYTVFELLNVMCCYIQLLSIKNTINPQVQTFKNHILLVCVEVFFLKLA